MPESGAAKSASYNLQTCLGRGRSAGFPTGRGGEARSAGFPTGGSGANAGFVSDSKRRLEIVIGL